MMAMRRDARRAAIAAACVGALGVGVLASGASGAGTLTLRATGPFSYNVTRLSTTAGKVTLTMRNASAYSHNVALRGRGIKTVRGTIVRRGRVSSVTVRLPRGSYTFFCSVPGHEASGMRGTLTIR